MRRATVLFALFWLGLSALGMELSLYSATMISTDGWREELGLGLCWGAVRVETDAAFTGDGLETASFSFDLDGDYMWLGAEASLSLTGFEEATVEAGLHLGAFGELGAAFSFDGEGFTGAQVSFGLGVPAEGTGEAGSAGLLLGFDEGGAVTGQVVSFGLSFPPWEAGSAAYFEAGSFLSLEMSLTFSGETVQLGADCSLDPEGISTVGGTATLTAEDMSLSADISWAPDGSWRGRGEVAVEPVSVWYEASRTGGLILWGAGVDLSLGTVGLGVGVEALEDGFSYSVEVSFSGDSWELDLSGSLDTPGYWEFLLSVDVTLTIGEGE